MKSNSLLPDPPADPPNPQPLPAPRYQEFFDENEESDLKTLRLKDLADEIILIRARMHGLLRAGLEPGISLSRLTSIVDLFSRAAARLARLLLHRQQHYLRRVQNPEYRADRVIEMLEANWEREEQAAIRSSEKPGSNLIIETPLTLSPFMRDALKSLLYPESEPLPAPGRPATDRFAVLEGILHKLLTRTPWYHLPLNYPPYTTCHRYYSIWLKSGLLRQVLLSLTLEQLVQEYQAWQEFEEYFGELHRNLSKERPHFSASEPSNLNNLT